jgi:hypothetical protein
LLLESIQRQKWQELQKLKDKRVKKNRVDRRPLG